MADRDTVTKEYMQDSDIFADVFNFLLYDAMQYVSQVEETAKSHRGGEEHAETGAEYLSGFYRTDRLLPVITLTLYFGADEWTAPKDLHGMLAANANILRFVDNYHIHLVAPADIAPEDFGKFHTELRLALKYLKYSRDKKKLNEVISEDTGYRSVSRKTADMINIVTGSKLNYHKGEERVNMCIAIEEMRKEAIEQGIERGIERGIEQGIERGIEQGIEQGIERGIEQGKVLGAIDIFHDLGMERGEILTRIISKFSLTRDEAESYLQKALANV